MSERRDRAPLAVFFLTLLPFLPVVRNGFVNWDDIPVLVDNVRYRGFGPAQLRWMFTNVVPGPYQPLSWLTLSLDQSLWGVHALAFHLTSLLLHALNAAVFYSVCRLLLTAALPAAARRDETRLVLSAALAALLFSVHPLRVESVVWATERRDVLCGLFYLLAVRSYLGGRAAGGSSRPRGAAATLGFFLLALLSKGIAISLPVTLLTLDVWPLGRLSGDPRRWREVSQRRVLLEKLPYAALSLVFLTIGYIGQRDSGALSAGSLQAPILQPLYGLFFYLGKTVLPWPLSPLYQRPLGAELLAPKYVLGALAALALGAAVLLRRREHPAPAAAAAHYAAALAPVLGFVAFGPQIAADRYSYLACLALPPLAVAPLLAARDERGFRRRFAAGTVVLLALGALTWRQTGVWRDSLTLWRAALAADPNDGTAHTNLGKSLDGQGDDAAAEAEYRRGLSTRPGDYDGQSLLGRLLLKQGRVAEAAEHFDTALRIAPGKAQAHYNVGVVLAQEKRWDEAISRYQEALALDPEDAGVRNNLGAALLATDRPDEALSEFRRALESRPDDAPARNNVAVILIRRGRYEEADDELRRVLRGDPSNASALANRAVLLRFGKIRPQ